ncbi:hypothetical protein EVAR_66400_1 [Eumeta japonica]|uniref:Uncharacterized protein n=1 Tax=Eumeta variegata TaxID=151549 RepID=A0A4C2A480_EUMVA|nr:hypothetical protein EVAR_66400_1 [Eumeta japonica]
MLIFDVASETYRNRCRYLARSFVRGSSTPLFLRVQVPDGGLTIASCPGVFSSWIRPRRVQVIVTPSGGPFRWVPSLVSSTDQALPLGWGGSRSSFERGWLLGDSSQKNSRASVQYSGGIHGGLDRLCHTSG